MKFFTYELIAASNGWVEQSEEEHRRAHERFRATAADYFRHLETLRPRVSRAAFDFFRHGYAETGLHDANLLSLSVGDGLGFVADGSAPFRLNRDRRAGARVEFLNYEQHLHHTFDLRGVVSVRCELSTDEDEYRECFGDLYTYELAGGGGDYLHLGFVFAGGSTIVFKFRKLVYRKRRLKRAYDVSAIYD